MKRLTSLGLCIGVCFALIPGAASGAQTPVATISNAAFEAHLNVLLPKMLERSKMAGSAVALVRDGKLVFTRGYGFADAARRTHVTTQTEFNVGSISKTVTAWGILKLVEAGKVDLDKPVDIYLKRWHLPKSPFDASKVTVRRLLSHTAGLSLPSVPEYAPGQPTPDLVSALSNPRDGVQIVADPGTKAEYSGGGYMVLQLLIEDVTGQSFSAYMRDAVLAPLGMRHSTYTLTPAVVENSATPYDNGKVAPYSHYVGEAAASLSSTAVDLGRFLSATFIGPNGEPPGRGVLKPSTIALMLSPAPGAVDRYGLKWGLGYDLWPIGGSQDFSAGHLGQNTGWSSVLWTSPNTRDGIVVLTNDSNGAAIYTPPFCDWISWVAAPSFGPFCSARANSPGGTLYGPLSVRSENPSLTSFIDGILGEQFLKRGAGAAVLIAQNGRVIFQATYGLADIASARPVTPSTPFYIASLAKSMTAYAVLTLISQNKIRLDDRLDRFLPDLPAWARGISVYELLTHQSGIPDYYDLIDYKRVKSLRNADALALLRNVKTLTFTPGTRFRYSNSNYLLLGQIIEHVTGQSLALVLQSRIFGPFGMHNAYVYDRARKIVPDRAIGYEKVGTAFLLDDYAEVQGTGGRDYHFLFTTTGAGGVFASLEDLFSWDRGLDDQHAVSPALLQKAFSPLVAAAALEPIDTVEGYGFGWFVSNRNGRQVIWHDGGRAGFRSVLARVPAKRLTVIVLSNLGQVNARHIAAAIIDHVVAPATEK